MNTGNLYNNDDLNVGVIWTETFEGNTVKCKLFMNNDNFEMDNGILSVYCVMANDNMPENIHLTLNDVWEGMYFIKVYLNDELYKVCRMADVNSDEIWEDFKFEKEDLIEEKSSKFSLLNSVRAVFSKVKLSLNINGLY